MNDKYELIPEGGLYRIKALRDFGDVKAGDIGGIVQGPENLDQDGTCWIYDDAKAIGCSCVSDNAKLRGNALLDDFASVHNDVEVGDNAKILNHAYAQGGAKISGNVIVKDVAAVLGGKISGNVILQDVATACHGVDISGNVILADSCYVRSTDPIAGDFTIRGYVHYKFVAETEEVDGYIKTLNVHKSGKFYIASACRLFTIAQAIVHWSNRPDRAATWAAIQPLLEIANA